MTISRVLPILALLLLPGLAQFAAATDYTPDSLETVKKQMAEKKALLVDVRDQAEWDRGHLEGAILLPFRGLQKGTTAADVERVLPKNKVIYTHCAVGARSLGAATILKDYGYDVRPLKEGYNDLLKSGFEKAK